LLCSGDSGAYRGARRGQAGAGVPGQVVDRDVDSSSPWHRGGSVGYLASPRPGHRVFWVWSLAPAEMPRQEGGADGLAHARACHPQWPQQPLAEQRGVILAAGALQHQAEELISEVRILPAWIGPDLGLAQPLRREFRCECGPRIKAVGLAQIEIRWHAG